MSSLATFEEPGVDVRLRSQELHEVSSAYALGRLARSAAGWGLGPDDVRDRALAAALQVADRGDLAPIKASVLHDALRALRALCSGKADFRRSVARADLRASPGPEDDVAAPIAQRAGGLL